MKSSRRKTSKYDTRHVEDIPKYEILAGNGPDDSLSWIGEADTLKEAKQRARQALTADYQRLVEKSEPYKYAMVINRDLGGCVADFFGKGQWQE